MTEPISKWEVVPCLRTFWFPAVAAWIAVSPMNAMAAATAEGGKVEASAPAVAQSSGESRTMPGHSATSIRANLARVAASAFEPASGGIVDLATFGAKPAAAILNVPAPGALSPVAPAKDHIPEPGAIGFGLAVAALIFGNFAKALMRCWKITSTTPNRKP